MISGPSESGKTTPALYKLNAFAWKYPGAQLVIARKVLADAYGTVLQTYRRVLGEGSPVVPYGGEKPQWFDYPTGSRIWVVGLDKPGKALSAERDVIYVNQAEQLEVEDWETLTTRVTGRAGNAPYSQIIGDCNPGPPHHWILARPSLRLLHSRHEDNPLLFDDDGAITDQGRRTLAILDNLTGVRLQRLRHGKWVQAEGAVYNDWDARVHLIDEMPAGWRHWRKFRAIDFGFTNPFVCQWWAADPDDRLYLYREVYRTQTLVSDHAREILRLSGDEEYEATVADHDAEGRATLDAEGIATVAADKAVAEGIQAVQARLRKAGDGIPRLFICRHALTHAPDPSLVDARRPTRTAEEIESYAWQRGAAGRAAKEAPVKQDDHGMDPMRYLVKHVDRPAAAGSYQGFSSGGPGRPGLYARRSA